MALLRAKPNKEGVPFQRRSLPSSSKLVKAEREFHLRTIYEEPDGKIPDMTRLERRKRSVMKPVLLWLMLIIAAVGALWAGKQYFQGGYERFGEEQVEMTMQVPSTIRSGETGTVKVNILNRSSAGLIDNDLLIEYPEGFTPTIVTPQTEGTEKKRWRLGAIPAGQSVSVAAEGLFWGTEQQEMQFVASLLTTPEQLRANFKIRRLGKTVIRGSVLSFSIDAPERTSVGEPVTVTGKLKNTGVSAMNSLQVSVNVPENFFVERTEPVLNTKEALAWKNVRVDSGKELSLKIVGNFVAPTDGVVQSEVQQKHFRWRLASGEGDGVPLGGEVDTLVMLSSTQLGVSIDLNGSTNETQSIASSGSLTFTLRVKNNSEASMKGVVARLQFNSDKNVPIDWAKAKTTGTPAREGNSFVWNPSALSELAEVKSKQTVTIATTVTLDPVALVPGQSFQAGATVSSNDGTATYSDSTKNITITLADRFTANAQAVYYNDDNIAVGKGPFPPQVGVPTTLRIIWSLQTGASTLEDIRMVSTLPPNVAFAGVANIGSGKLKSDNSTRTIAWSLTSLTPKQKIVTAEFGVTMTPTKGDIGSLLTLVGPISLSARDGSSGAVVTRTLDALTTNLSSDPQFSSTTGVVGEKPKE